MYHLWKLIYSQIVRNQNSEKVRPLKAHFLPEEIKIRWSLGIKVEVTGTWEKKIITQLHFQTKVVKNYHYICYPFLFSLWNRFVHVPVVEEPVIEARNSRILKPNLFTTNSSASTMDTEKNTNHPEKDGYTHTPIVIQMDEKSENLPLSQCL